MAFSDRCSEGAKKALALAQDAARSMGHNYVGSEHLLLGLINEGEGAAARALAAFNITADGVLERSEQLVGPGDYHFTDSFGYTPRTKKILELSLYEAKAMKASYISTEHILLAILRERDSVAVRILEDLGADIATLRAFLSGQSEQGAQGAGVTNESSGTPVLDQYGRDLTGLARDGELDPLIGREKEIERVIQILSRRTKNNPVLIGDPGVGKSAIIEGLAQKIASGKIPELLRDKRIVTLDLASMIAGTKYRGEFEERINNAIAELRADAHTILFIDELHTIVGAGASEGSVDAANILKPALARGEIQIIGATSLDEYRKHIEKDAALARRFQPVTVGEPSKEEAEEILLGLRERYEAHHKARITDEAVHAAVELSWRYISDRFLPDKAIDLMDEAASRVRLRVYNAPPDMKKLRAKLETLLKQKEEAVSRQDYETAAAVRDEEMEQLLKQRKHHFARCRIKIARRLVRHYYCGRSDYGARYARTLLLSAAHLRRALAGAFGYAYHIQRLKRAPFAFPLFNAAQHQRQCNVFYCRILRQQPIRLKYKPYMRAAEANALDLAHSVYPLTKHVYAAIGRAFKPGNKIEQSRFAAAASAGNTDKFAACDLHIYTAQGMHLARARVIVLLKPFYAYRAFAHALIPPATFGQGPYPGRTCSSILLHPRF